MKFNINEIFFSIQGEGTRAGRKCTFIRFQGCLLRCSWCDTPYALERKEIHNLMSEIEIIEKIKSYDNKLVMLTGGEPLEQKGIFDFINLLCDAGFEVTIETNGQADISKIDSRAVKIYDIKCPDSLMSKKNNYNNINYLNGNDEIKFVINSRKDFDWALNKCKELKLYDISNTILFSPVLGKVQPIDLASWVLETDSNIRMQLQLHKYIWDVDKKGV